MANPRRDDKWTRPRMAKTTLTELYDAYQLERLPSPATTKHYNMLLGLYRVDIQALNQDPENPLALRRNTVLLWRQAVLDRASSTTWNNYSSHMRALWNMGIEAKLLTEFHAMARRSLSFSEPSSSSRSASTSSCAWLSTASSLSSSLAPGISHACDLAS